MSVSPHHRRRGYGQAMLERALLHAAHLGLRKVYLLVLRENAPMLALARKAGFDIAFEENEAVASKRIERTPDMQLFQLQAQAPT